MRKWIQLLAPVLFLMHSLQAQDRVGCTQLLEDAREAYAAGMVELVPELLLPCLESGLTGTARQDAYKLVINAYLFDYLPEMADSLMSGFLDAFPDYQAAPSDPAEFALLLRSHQQERAARQEELARQQELARREELARQQELARQEQLREEAEARARQEPHGRERRREAEPGTGREGSRTSLGFTLGVNATLPVVIEPYSTGVPLEDQGQFNIGGPGFQAGITANLPLGRVPEITLELYFNRTRFDYSASPFVFTDYVVEESENRIQLPISMLFRLNPDSRTTVFLRAGIMTDYMIGASVSATRTYSGTGSSFLRDVVLEKQDITNSRRTLNLSGQFGAGIRIPFSGGFVFFETRFHSGLTSINREEERYNLQNLTWLIYHVDSDFRIQQLGLLAGLSWNL